MPSYYHKLTNHLKNTDETVPDEQEFNNEHAYVGAQHLYLKNKLKSGEIHRNLRENGYKHEYITKYDEIYHIMFSLYWVLFVIYVGLCAYNSQFFVHTFVIIIILIAFPFFINPLTDIVKTAMNDGLDYMNHFSISDPNIAKKGEEWVEDVQKDFYESKPGEKITKAFVSGTDSASSGSDYVSGYIRKSNMSNSKRDLEDLLNSVGTPPDVPTIMTLDWIGEGQLIGNEGGGEVNINPDSATYIQQPSIKIYRAPIAGEIRGEDGLLYEFKLDRDTKWIKQNISNNNNKYWTVSYETNMKTAKKHDGEPIVKARANDRKGIDTDDNKVAYFKLILNNRGTIAEYRWEYFPGEPEWTPANVKESLGSGLSIPIVSNGKTIYRWEKQDDDSWIKKGA
tara:strand:+ start:1338 stop:2522 length:1185 start_codon:yes stop_codon:yes gene_type:complete